MTSWKVKTTGSFMATQYTMMGMNRNSVLPPLTWLKATLFVAVLLEVVIWKFISTDRRVQLDGAMYHWISTFGVWCGCMGVRQFSQKFIVVSCTRKRFTVCHTHVLVHACTYPCVVYISPQNLSTLFIKVGFWLYHARLMNICIIAITMLCQCFLHTSLHLVILSLSTEPGKGNEERAAQEDSLHTEVKSECIRCLPVCMHVQQYVPVYLDVHQFVPVYLDMWFVAGADQSAKCVYLNYCTLVIIIKICQLVA